MEVIVAPLIASIMLSPSSPVFVVQIMPDSYEPFTIFILAPGAFFVLACLVALQNKVKKNMAKKGKEVPKSAGCGEG